MIVRAAIGWRLASLVGASLVASTALAHPGSGIVVGRLGQVYFVDTGLGLWEIDLQGRLGRHEGPANHWLTIDHEGRFAGVRLPEPLPRDVSVVGTRPALILGGDFPLAIGADGALYYPHAGGDGPVRLLRLTPTGGRAVFATLPDAFELGPGGRRVRARWIHGLAGGPDGSLYYTERHAVRRIDASGSVSLVAGGVTVPDCLSPPAITEARVVPALRGLDIGPGGVVYVAASGCSALLRITPAGDVSVVLRSSDGWSPTGVAVAGSDLYVLEYRYVPGGPRDWLPRVRKVAPDGTVTVLATVTPR
jgi:hypothetical protein